MSKPPRDRHPANSNTYFVTTNAHGGRAIFQSGRMANLVVDTLDSYRAQARYLLHEFVVMPNHLHLLITPLENTTLERSMQLIKGGFSFRAKRELQFNS